MKIVQNIIAAVLAVLGILWILQGSNVMAGTVMSGQSTWLYVGIVLLIVGLGLGYWTNFRRR